MPLTQYYHVRDPMENLLISVTLRKISGFGSDNSVPLGRTWTYCFQWQEKKLSLSEKKRELEHLEARGIQLSKRKRGDRSSPESDNADILSSYVDVDDFIPNEYARDPPTTSKNSITHLTPPDLTRRPRDKRNEASWTSNQHRAWLRANREDKFRAMHIIALIEGVERVLCSLRFYKETGLFCATPGFSASIVEPENDPDLLIKGPKLSTYHIPTPSGSLYEYVLDNIHDLLPFASAEDQRLSRDIRLQEEKRDRAEVTRWQQLNKNPKLFEQRISGNNMQHKMMISLEVVAVDNPQTTDPIFVEYELELPGRAGYPQWKFQAGNNTRKRDVPIHKPIFSIRDQMEELFLGIDESTEDDDFIAGRLREVNADESPISTTITSRLGQKTESTGTTVRIRCNIVDLPPSKHPGGANSARLSSPSIPPSLTNTRIVKRSVQEILQSVKLEKRLASITDPRIQAALRSSPPTDEEATAETLIDKSDLV
ncbi:hypothetical protein F441_19069 [Phytophthora nicotianae CJ01A1]|uniref:Uncharacterized protein n=1 Tax=Phytophthora nicotianae CJ01A1 TaxID=1317063 RepID=W2W274_PHYNI|nr:hypothetical protein F441_19069 [Phytophthora nicotianae CJ01A1]